MDRQQLQDTVLALRKEAFSCSETTLVALCRAFDTGIDENLLRNLAVGFRGGIGATFAEGTCGALSGSVMAAGLIKGNDRKATVLIARELFKKFHEHYGTVACGLMYAKGHDHCNSCCIFAATRAAELLSTES